MDYILDPDAVVQGRHVLWCGRKFAAFHARRDGARWFVYGYLDGDSGSHVIAKLAGRAFSRKKVFGRPVLAGFRTKAEADLAARDLADRTARRYVVYSDGRIEEWSVFDLAGYIGPEVNTSHGIRQRWQAANVDGHWGVVDARFPDNLVRLAKTRLEAIMVAAEWNVDDGCKRDLSRLGIHVVTDTLDEAKQIARDLAA